MPDAEADAKAHGTPSKPRRRRARKVTAAPRRKRRGTMNGRHALAFTCTALAAVLLVTALAIKLSLLT